MSVVLVARVRGPAIATASVLLALVLLFGAATARPTPGDAIAGSAAVAGLGPCPGPRESAAFSGTLALDGGPLASSAVAGVPLNVSYYEEVNVTYTLNDTPVSLHCELVHVAAAAVTDGYGLFNGTIVPSADGCGSEYCTFYTGPFGPITVNPQLVPDGYGLSSSVSGSSFRLTWVAGLAEVSVSPNGTAVPFATGSARSFSATPRMANGSVSPLASEFHWTLAGTGWSLSASPGARSVTILAGSSAGTARLSASASATAGNLTFETPSVTVNLTSVATTVEHGSLDRTVVDVGEPDPFSLASLGALGYDYRATVDPGPGGSNTSANCTTTPRSATVAEVDCAGSVTYSAPGTAELLVNVTNGYSNATWRSPPLTIDPAPVLRATPATPVGYPGVALPIVLHATNGSGDSPYRVACFDPGPLPLECSTTGGPNWTFLPVYAIVGSFTATAWAIDATGTNRSVTLPVTVVDPLSVGPLGPSNTTLGAGVRTILSAVVAGGALPAEAWWNASDLAGPIRTAAVVADGVISASFVPPAAGTVTVSLTVRDALGTTQASTQYFVVDPGPATQATALTPASMSPTALGRPVALAWQARDALGEPTADIGGAVDLVVRNSTGAAAPSWADVAHLGELSTAPQGAFTVPPTAWSAGMLYLNLTPAVAGLLRIAFDGPGLSGGSVTVPVAAPDLDHLRLFDPTVALAGDQVNRTFWHVSDRAGDPVPGAILTLEYSGPNGTSDTLLAVEWVAPGATGAWVNYSFPGTAEGSVVLRDSAGDVLVGPVPLAASSSARAVLFGPALPLVAIPAALVTGVASASFVARTRRREVRVVVPDEEEEARRFAEGRAEVIELVRSVGPADLATIAAGWGTDRPPPDLDDWVRSLVADGTLTAATMSDGRVAYTLAAEPPEPSAPRVTLDPDALERAVAARDAGVGGAEEERP